ncbi:type II-A CRISPR-associated protein Csn2 [uncultured Limosilactobacillus sp.]|uniref:type II-A CRISPR-associated protein Csn2 n=1 Tax=uncultured Limosilactobacillus sp. TaxID=2837629 RepID=UPI0025D2113A|nr:type II-A CRISPR-associated protein Csn2 [uncultured Limosilactobacillus sp.]
MKLTYNGHKSVSLNPGEITVVATNTPVVFNEIMSGLNDFNELVKLVDDSYNSLEVTKMIDLDSEVLMNHKLYEKYSKDIVKAEIDNMPLEYHEKVNKEVQRLFTVLQESLFMTDLPIEVSYDGDLKRLLSYSRIKLSAEHEMRPYDIIASDLKIHLECNLKSIVCFCNIANYLSRSEFCELQAEVKSLNIPLLLIEFSEINERSFYQESNCLFIDQDFIDWML